MKIEECWEADGVTYYVRIGSQWLEVVKGWGGSIVEPEDVDIGLYIKYVIDDCQEITEPPEWVYDELSASGLEVRSGTTDASQQVSCENCINEEPYGEEYLVCDLCRGFSMFKRRGDESA